MPHKIDFTLLDWESPLAGIRQKVFQSGRKQIRLIEYSQQMQPHWCEKGHYGYILEGVMEIEFAQEKHAFAAGDGVFIPAGAEHRHRGRAITDVVRIIFVEDV